MVGMVDVARRAGVSVATVSRVLNGVSVRPELDAAVRAAVVELRYSRNRTARSLRRRTADVIGLVVADIENPFFTAFARKVEDAAQREGYSVVLCNSDEDVSKERRYLSVAIDEQMAGVIVFPASNETDLSMLTAQGTAVVVVDRPLGERYDTVTFDNVHIGAVAAGALARSGRSRIACITGPQRVVTAVDRARGWRAAMTTLRLATPPDYLWQVPFRVGGGQAAMAELLALAEPPDAVLATNNLVGVGALRQLSQVGVTDIKVGVIGDLPFATSLSPAVQVTPLNPGAMGEVAWQMLAERISGAQTGPARRVTLDVADPRPQA